MTRHNRRSTGGVTKIGDLVPQLIVQCKLHRYKDFEQLEEAWRQAVGEPFAAVTQVSGLHRGTLTIKVPHNAFMQELSFRCPELIDTLTTLLKDEKIKRIRFEV